MEHISEILRKQTRINTSNKNTDTWSSAEPAEVALSSACPLCRGAGFVHPLLPSEKPDFSRVVPCRCTQQESGEGRQDRLQRYSNLGALVRLTFENLLPEGRTENPAAQEQFSRAYRAARAFAVEPGGWLVFTGPSGCGKTHLAAAIANHCIANNHPVLYSTAPDLLDRLRATFSPDSQVPYDDFFEQVRNAPLLILDDLGVQSSTPWAREKLDQLLNHRSNNQLPTVIISIVPLEELAERIRTRLITASSCQVYAIDEESSALSAYSSWAPQFELQKSTTFASFDWKRVNLPLEQRQNLEKAFQLAREFAESPDGWLVFQGVNGCGKTHLAAAIVNHRYGINEPAQFVVVPDFLDHLRSTFNPESKISYDQIFEGVKSTPLLVLDDFGKQTTTPWAQEKLYQVINYRYNARLPTVVTTNCSTDEMDSPISSRFVDPKISTLFNITAPDYWAGRSNQKRTGGGGRKGRWS